MTATHVHILTLLSNLADAKGPATVELRVRHWLPKASGAAAGSRGVEPAAGRPMPAPAAQEPAGSPGNVLRIGEHIELTGRSPIDGYLHLFDLGTDGTCVRLVPSPWNGDNRIAAGREFRFPPAGPADAALGPQVHFEARGPASSAHGQPERLLAVVTADRVDLDVAGLDPALRDRGRSAARRDAAPAEAAPVRFETSRLLALPAERWAYGLLEMEVR